HGELARRVPEVEARDPDGAALTAEDGRTLRARERARLLDLGAAKDTAVAGGERLRDRRRRAKDVDDDPDLCPDRLKRREGDVDAHAATTLPPWSRCAPATGTPIARPRSRAPSAAARSAPTAWSLP